MLSFGKVIFTLSVIILLGLPVYHNVGQALEPNQIAIIANLNSTDSQAIAEYYCQKRGIPASQILSIDMPETESVSRDTYTRGIALRRTAQHLKQHTHLKVILDNKAPLFPPQACPETTIYCGWYKLRQYVDSFQFNVGAVGYHIVSLEAETLGRKNQKITFGANACSKKV